MAARESREPRARGVGGHPDKVCARCGRPFSWRKKWARDWDQVKYCSDRCRMGRGTGAPPAPTHRERTNADPR